MARNLGYLLGFSVIHLPVTFEMMLLKDKLRHMKNVKSLFQQKLIQFGQCQTRSTWVTSNQKHLMEKCEGQNFYREREARKFIN